MRKKICSTYARKQIVQYLFIGSICLPLGIFLAVWSGVFSGTLWDVIENLGKNSVYIFVILFLITSGAYLLLSGIRGLLNTEATDICRYIHTEFPPGEKTLTGKKLLALVDEDLASALEYSGGNILIGREWLFVRNAWGKPVIRLKNIHKVWHCRTKNGRVILKFVNSCDVGPVTRELTAVEAADIEACLQCEVAYHKDFSPKRNL